MASSIPDAQTGLFDMLDALTGTGEPLEGVGVILNGVWDTRTERELITVGDERDITREWRSLGAQRLTETFTLPVTVETADIGVELRAVKTRLWDLVSVVEQTVLGDLTLNGAVLHTLPAGSEAVISGPSTDDQNVLVATTTLTFRCEAVISLS